MVERIFLAGDPNVTTRITDAEPMTMPSIVSINATLLARKLSTASRTTSLNTMVERALARVRSNELDLERWWSPFFYCLMIGLLQVSQRCTVSR